MKFKNGLVLVISYSLLLILILSSYINLSCRQIEIDSKFLEAQHIMDYSLLLGVHYRAPQHLRTFMSSNRSVRDGLEMLAEEGNLNA